MLLDPAYGAGAVEIGGDLVVSRPSVPISGYELTARIIHPTRRSDGRLSTIRHALGRIVPEWRVQVVIEGGLAMLSSREGHVWILPPRSLT